MKKLRNHYGRTFLSVLTAGSLLCCSIPLQNAKPAEAKTATYKIAAGEKITVWRTYKGKRVYSGVKYTSSNKKIAKVSKKGVVTGKKKGTVKITMTYKKRK